MSEPFKSFEDPIFDAFSKDTEVLNRVAHDLFLLMINLTQIRDDALILKIFSQAVDGFVEGLKVTYSKFDPVEPHGRVYEIATMKSHYGWLAVQCPPSRLSDEIESLIQNAIGMLAVILERNYQNRLLENDKVHLESLVQERTRELEDRNVLLKQEIEHRQRYETEREKMVLKLEQQNAELEEFIYTVSHEMKSPLITIRGHLGLLLEYLKNQELDKIDGAMQFVVEATDRMDALLHEILELSRIGRKVTPFEWLDMRELIQNVILSFKDSCDQEFIQFKLDQEFPGVYAERKRIVKVFQNLVENAIKYGKDEDGKVFIEIGIEKKPELYFYIKDYGSGIVPQYHERIFKLFEQLNPEIPGIGVGLTMVRRIVQFYGGRIWTESDGAGSGACFCFTLPLTNEISGSVPDSFNE